MKKKTSKRERKQKMNRKLKVHAQSMGPNYIQVPTITLKGQWLKQAGFDLGDYVEVECNGDRITLTKTTLPGNKELSLEKKIQKLDKKQKARLSRMIDEMK